MATKPIKIKILGDAKQFNATLKQSEDDLGRFGRGVKNISGKAVAAAKIAGVAAVAAGAKGVASFAAFEQQMNEVFTLLPGVSEKAMGEMTGQVKDFAKEFGILPNEAVPALYSALSAGVPQDNVFEFMEVAAKAAKGGVTTLETAVDGITSVVNAYGDEVITATEASDYMFTAVRLGKTTFEELSNSISMVTPIAVAAGVGMDEVSASIAVLTASGVPTATAATQIKGAIAELSREGSKADTVFRDLSGESFAQFIENGGSMGDAFQMMNDHAVDTGGSVLDMFGRVEAGAAVLSLAKEDGEAYAETLEEMQGAAGATDAAFDVMSKGLQEQFNKIKAAFAVLMIDIGEKLEPVVRKAIEIIRISIGKMKDAWENMRPAVQRFIDKAKELAEKWLPKVRGWLQKVIDKVKKLADEWLPKIRDWFQKVIDTVKKLADEWLPKIRDWMQKVIDKVKKLADEWLPKLRDGFQDAIDKIKDLVDTWLPKIGAALQTAFQWIIDNKDYIIGAVIGIGTGLLIYAVPGAIAAAAAFGATAIAAFSAAAAMVAAALPAVALAALFAGLAAGAVWAYQNVGWFREGVDKVAQWFKKDFLPTMRLVWDAVWGLIKHYINLIRTIMRVYIAWAKLLWENFGKTLMRFVEMAWGAISTIIDGALKFIQGVIQVVTGIIKGDWSLVWEGIKSIFVGVWEGIKGALALALAVVMTSIQIALDAITLAWNLAWSGIKLVFATIWDGIKAALGLALAFIQSAIQIQLDAITLAWNLTWNAIKGTFVTIWNGIEAALDLALGVIDTAIQIALAAITLYWSLVWTGIKTAFETAWDLVETAVTTGIDTVTGFFEELPGKITGAVSTLADAIKSPFVVAFNAIKALWNNTVGGFGFTVPSWIPGVGGKGFKIPYIGGGGSAYGGGVTGAAVDAFFANGGFVNGPTVAMIGEAGPELVLPLTRPARTQELLSEHGLAGGGASVTNIHVSARTDADPDAIAQQVAWQIRVGGI